MVVSAKVSWSAATAEAEDSIGEHGKRPQARNWPDQRPSEDSDVATASCVTTGARGARRKVLAREGLRQVRENE